MLQLFLTHSKIFDHTDEKGINHHIAVPRTVDGRPVPVPSWVKETTTYQFGVKDGTVRDLTPPKPRARKPEPEPAKPVEVAETVAVVDDLDEDEDTRVQTTKTRGGRRAAGSSTGLQG
jgi:hypothetical protein